MENIEYLRKDGPLSCENYLPSHSEANLENILDIANKLNISLIAIEDLNLESVNQLTKSWDNENYQLISLQDIYENTRKNHFTVQQLKEAYKKYLTSYSKNTIAIVSRKTIIEESVESIKKILSTIRTRYEIISVHSNDKTILKWAAHDRRIDYITIELQKNSENIDKALCSVVKQNGKCIEIVLSALLSHQTDKELSTILRKGRKLLKLLLLTKTPFIFTIKPKSPYHLRNGYQMRYLGEIFDAPYNKTKNCVFENQLSILTTNTIKLHDSHLVEGLRMGFIK